MSKPNFKDNFKQNIAVTEEKTIETKETVQEPSVEDGSPKFRIGKKAEDKSNKKTFNVYMENELVKELDKISRKTGYSRNELISLMCKFCTENIEFEQ